MAKHRALIPLRWSDMDAFGHVNNVQYLRLLEEARIVVFAAAGSDEGGSLIDTGVLVARSTIEYLRPLVYRTAPIVVDMWVTRISGASFDLAYEVLDDEDTPRGLLVHGASADDPHGHGTGPHVYARAETTLVLYDLAQQRPRRMSPTEKARLEAWSGEPVVWRHKR